MGSPLPHGWEQCLDLKSGLIFYKNVITGVRTYSDPRLTTESCGSDAVAMNGSLIHSDTYSPGSSHMKQLNYPYLSPAAFTGQLEAGSRQQRNFIEKQVDLDLRLSLKRSDETSPCSSLTFLSAPNEHPKVTSHNIPIAPLSSLSFSSASKCSSSSSSPSVISFQEDEETVEALEVESSEPGRFGIDSAAKDREGAAETMYTAGCLNCLMYVLLSTKHPRCPQCGNTMLFNFPTKDDLQTNNKPHESDCALLVQYLV